MQTDQETYPMTKTTKITGLDHVVAWDESERRHVYLDGGDSFKATRGSMSGRAMPRDRHHERRKGFMAIPGFVNVHSHPFSEPANKGLTEEYGSDKLGQSSLYEYLPVFGLDPEDAGPSTQVAMSELLKSGVTTIADLSMSREGWIDDLAATASVPSSPMMRQGYWTPRRHTGEYALTRRPAEAVRPAMKTIDAAMSIPAPHFGDGLPLEIDTARGLFKERTGSQRATSRADHASRRSSSSFRGHRTARPDEWLYGSACLAPTGDRTASSERHPQITSAATTSRCAGLGAAGAHCRRYSPVRRR